MSLWFTGENGLRLAASAHGPEDGVPVLMLGGMGQTQASWRRAAEQVAASGRRAITIDLRGHGESDWAPDGDYTLPRYAADIIRVAEAMASPPVLVGASLGGKIALAAAGQGGSRVARALVMVDTVPRTDAAGVAQVTRVLHPPEDGFASLNEAAAELARLRGQSPQEGAGEKLRRNMRQTPDGRWHWHWDPAVTAPSHALGAAPMIAYLEQAASQVTVPTLLTRGELSPVVSEAGIAAFRALVPQARVETISGAAHMLVGDQNDAFAAALLDFLNHTPGL